MSRTPKQIRDAYLRCERQCRLVAADLAKDNPGGMWDEAIKKNLQAADDHATAAARVGQRREAAA